MNNIYARALTADIIAGIEEGDRDAVDAAYGRLRICKASSARKLTAALRAAGYDPTPAHVDTPAEAPAAPKAPARKTAAQRKAEAERKAHTDARKAAWATLMAARAAGKPMTYAEACALHGTQPAKAAKK